MRTKESLVAIIDDDQGVCRALARLVRSLGHRSITYPSGEEFLTGLQMDWPDHVLLDFNLPGLRGAELLAELKRRRLSAPIVVMTGLDRAGVRETCLEAGAAAFVTKPILRDDLELLLGDR